MRAKRSASLVVFIACVLLVVGCGGVTMKRPSITTSRHFASANAHRFGTPASPGEGDVLIASTGRWSGSPTGFAYQWQDCDSNGANCSDIDGATTNRYALTADDAGHTVRVKVTASYSGHPDATQYSAPTVLVTGGGEQTLDCFNASSDGSNPAPGVCGYPDPNAASNTSGAWATSGVSGETGVGPVCDSALEALIACTLNTKVACTSLPNTWGGGTMSGAGSVLTSGHIINNTNITGGVNVDVADPTFHDDCIHYAGDGVHGNGIIVNLLGGSSSGTATFTDDSIYFANATTQSGEKAIIDNSYIPVNVSHAYIYNCAECLHDGGPFTVTDSYVYANGLEPWWTEPVEHTEVLYDNDGSDTFQHDVLLNPVLQEAVLFDDCIVGGGSACNSPCTIHFTVKNSLLSGGHAALELCTKNSGAGTSVLDIENNHFARCTTPSIVLATGDRYQCQGVSDQYTLPGSNGADSHGFLPYGGATAASNYMYCGSGGRTWSGNVWDDNGATVSCTG